MRPSPVPANPYDSASFHPVLTLLLLPFSYVLPDMCSCVKGMADAKSAHRSADNIDVYQYDSPPSIGEEANREEQQDAMNIIAPEDLTPSQNRLLQERSM